MPIHTDYSTSNSRGGCGGGWCPGATTSESIRMRSIWGEVLVAGWYSVEEEWIVATESGSCQVNDTSADTGWWETALCPPRRTSFLCSQPKGGGAVLLWVSFPVSGAKTADLLGVCPEQMLCRFVFLCRRQEIWVNRRLSGTFNVMIF